MERPDYEKADTISIDTLFLDKVLQEERVRDIENLRTLPKKVCYLHTNMLYYRESHTNIGANCFEAWKAIIKRVGGVPKLWRELGHYLGLSKEDLDYIGNTMKDDPTDIVLKVFMQNENATLDKILDALLTMKRFDIVKGVEEPLWQLAECFQKDDSKSDTGYHSSSKYSYNKEIISLNKISIDLPPVLKRSNFNNVNSRPPPITSFPIQANKMAKEDKRTIFLTYTEDGYDTALNLQNIANSWDEKYDVEVIVLNNKKNEIAQNPERFIRVQFDKADYIVPIITRGYLDEISSESADVSCIENLDFKYVRFIYKLIMNYYIGAGCINKKTRSILPLTEDPKVVIDMAMYPDLMPWIIEEEFEKTFINLLSQKI